MRFIIYYKIGPSLREDVIEAEDLDQAEVKASRIHPSWVDIVIKNHKPEVLA